MLSAGGDWVLFSGCCLQRVTRYHARVLSAGVKKDDEKKSHTSSESSIIKGYLFGGRYAQRLQSSAQTRKSNRIQHPEEREEACALHQHL